MTPGPKTPERLFLEAHRAFGDVLLAMRPGLSPGTPEWALWMAKLHDARDRNESCLQAIDATLQAFRDRDSLN